MMQSQQYLVNIYLQEVKKRRTSVQRSEMATKKMVKHLINHQSQSSCYLFVCFFFSSFQLNCLNAYISKITSEQLSTDRCYEVIVMSLNRQILTEIFIRNISEKVRSSSDYFVRFRLNI